MQWQSLTAHNPRISLRQNGRAAEADPAPLAHGSGRERTTNFQSEAAPREDVALTSIQYIDGIIIHIQTTVTARIRDHLSRASAVALVRTASFVTPSVLFGLILICSNVHQDSLRQPHRSLAIAGCGACLRPSNPKSFVYIAPSASKLQGHCKAARLTLTNKCCSLKAWPGLEFMTDCAFLCHGDDVSTWGWRQLQRCGSWTAIGRKTTRVPDLRLQGASAMVQELDTITKHP